MLNSIASGSVDLFRVFLFALCAETVEVSPGQMSESRQSGRTMGRLGKKN